jgi:hypothetical protein
MAKRQTEESLIIPVLSVLSIKGPTESKELPKILQNMVHLYQKDKECLEGRSTTYFEQTIYNMISHRKLGSLVNHTKVGKRSYILSLTAEGKKYLKKNFK